MPNSNILSYIEMKVPWDRKDIFRDIYHLTQLQGKKVAFHGSCTDGTITAALLKHIKEGDVFIPLNYDILKDSTLRPYLANLDWHVICDLEPFNNKQIELYVDHHRSVIGQPINAKKIYFESGESGPSAAWVLYQSIKDNYSIPKEIEELIHVSRVTDTASFNINPPTERIQANHQNIPRYINNFDEYCWFIQDATSFEKDYSVKANIELVDAFASDPKAILTTANTINRINTRRNHRKLAYDFAASISIVPLIVVINSPNKTFQQTLALILGQNGVKIICFLNEKEDLVTVSLRQSKKNTKAEIENYRLDLLAKMLNPGGGGHAEAAGSAITNLQNGISIIKNWAENKQLTMKSINLLDETDLSD